MLDHSATRHIPALVTRLYEIVGELEAHFPGRPFTPDGHLVGSLGEVLAASHYGLTLLPPSATAHDASAPDGRLVQIKATQKARVAMRANCEHLIVLLLRKDGSAAEVYNGPGEPAWNAAGPVQTNGQRSVSVSVLRGLMKEVHESARLVRRVV